MFKLVNMGFLWVFRIFAENRVFPILSKKLINKSKKHRNLTVSMLNVGAAGQIRTADLILTKDALYLLSYSSKVYAP